MSRRSMLASKRKTVWWHQLVPLFTSSNSKTENGVVFVDNRDGSYTVSTVAGGATANTTLDVIPYSNRASYTAFNELPKNNVSAFLFGCPAGGSATTYKLASQYGSFADFGNGKIWNKTTASYTLGKCNITVFQGTVLTTPVVFKPKFCITTDMFGNGNEPDSLSNEKIVWIKAYAELHPAYNPGEEIEV